jgi:hypothetical protein
MKAPTDSILTMGRGGMELTWRYAWAGFLAQLAIRRHFPLPAAVFAFLMAAVLTRLPAGKSWRVYQKLLLQIAGFIPPALLVVHTMQYPALPFFSLEWIGHLFMSDKSFIQWLVLVLMLLCVWLIWRGGQILAKSSQLYFPVCMHFDKGLGLFFLLLITKAFVVSRTGLHLEGREILFLAIAYLVFSLTAIGMARNQGNVSKSFLSGRRGIGVILTTSTLVILLAIGTTLIAYPHLHSAADSLHTITKKIARPMDPVLMKMLLFWFRPKERSLQPDAPPTHDPGSTDVGNAREWIDMDAQAVEGWGGLFQRVAGWGLLGIVGTVFVGALICLMIYLSRLLLKKSRDDGVHPLSTGWIWEWLRKWVALPRLMRRGRLSFLRGADSAAIVYAGMLRWGRWSGLLPLLTETPIEYGNRLMHGFPGLRSEIGLIVQAFNREVYGQRTTDRETLSRLRSALRRMKRLRYGPSRIKAWFRQ